MNTKTMTTIGYYTPALQDHAKIRFLKSMNLDGYTEASPFKITQLREKWNEFRKDNPQITADLYQGYRGLTAGENLRRLIQIAYPDHVPFVQRGHGRGGYLRSRKSLTEDAKNTNITVEDMKEKQEPVPTMSDLINQIVARLGIRISPDANMVDRLIACRDALGA